MWIDFGIDRVVQQFSQRGIGNVRRKRLSVCAEMREDGRLAFLGSLGKFSMDRIIKLKQQQIINKIRYIRLNYMKKKTTMILIHILFRLMIMMVTMRTSDEEHYQDS